MIIILRRRRKASDSVGGWAERERERMEEGKEEGRDRRRKGGLCYIKRPNQTIKQSTCLTLTGMFLPVEMKSSMLKDLSVA